MDTWVVGRKPIGLYEVHPPTPPTDPTASPKVRSTQLHQSEATHAGFQKTCVFFFKAHIMTGQVRPGKSVTNFAWLTKKEISKRVDEQYWNGIKDMLSDF
jgi:large subunit ribosomal protein L46